MVEKRELYWCHDRLKVDCEVGAVGLLDFFRREQDEAVEAEENEKSLPKLNRHAMQLRPKEAMIRWLKSQPDADPEWTAESLSKQDRNVYLVPADETGSMDELQEWLKDHFEPFFEEELSAWYTREGVWPADRSYNTFLEFFEPVLSTLVVDAGDDEIMWD